MISVQEKICQKIKTVYVYLSKERDKNTMNVVIIILCNLISHAITSILYFQIFRMSETLECYIVLQLIVSILSLLSVLIQLIVIIVPSWDRIAKNTILTFSIISTVLSLISFGLSDHYSIQHITVLCLILCTGILQTIFLGIAILKKISFVYSVHAHIV